MSGPRFSQNDVDAIMNRARGGPAAPAKARKKTEHRESHQQALVIAWWEVARLRYQPGFPAHLLYSVPNGGRRGPILAMFEKKMGLRKGAPDLVMDIARQGFHGLRVEMKSAKGKVSPEQQAFHMDLRHQGYAVHVCWSADEAINVIEGYLA